MAGPPVRLPRGLYYGWVIVAVSFWANWITAPLNPVVFSIFIVSIRDDLHVSLGTLAWCITARQISAGISAPALGHLVDRFGPRWLGAACAAWAGACTVGLSFAPTIWVMYGLFFLSGFSGFGVFGGGQILTGVPPANWFIAKRGLAVSYALTGGGLGTASWVVISSFLITTIGWRAAWQLNGVLIAATLVPLYGVLMRRRPEDVGLYPDGASAPVASVGPAGGPRPHGTSVAVETNFTLRDAMRTSALWLITAAFVLHTFATNGILFVRVPFWREIGIEPGAIGFAVASDPFVVMLFTLLFGYMAERFPIRLITASGGAWRAASMLPLLFAGGGVPGVFLHNITWGVGSAGMGTGQNLVVPAFFGRQAQGAIRGFTSPIMIGAGAMSAPLVGNLLDAGLPYSAVFIIAAVMMAAAGGIFLFVVPPAAPRSVPGEDEAVASPSESRA